MSAGGGSETDSTRDRQVIHAAIRVLAVEEELLRAFATGLLPSEVAKRTQLSPPAVTRALRTLAQAGWAEQLPDTGRWRASHRVGRMAVAAVRGLDQTIAEASESRRRLDPSHDVATHTY